MNKTYLPFVILGVVVVLVTILAFTLREKPLPKEANVDVPFTAQAPVGNWSEPWANACEETSVYMVSSFYAEDEIQRDEAVKKIREIFDTKSEDIQVSRDESLATIEELIKTLGLPWNTTLKADPTIDDLKTELAADRPVIVPVYAPQLNNPHYTGVEYHVLVLVGYNDADGTFIVNDPGTQYGEEQRFAYDIFMNAIHDLNAGDLAAGKKAVLFTSRQLDWSAWLEQTL